MRSVVFLGIAAGCGGVSASSDAPAPGPDAAHDAAAIDGAGVDADTCPALTSIDPTVATELVVAGDAGSTLGIFDPSVVYPAGAPGGAMSYSSVPDQHSIRTRIALSPDAGATWTFVVEA